jgi:hypothetical protein
MDFMKSSERIVAMPCQPAQPGVPEKKRVLYKIMERGYLAIFPLVEKLKTRAGQYYKRLS